MRNGILYLILPFLFILSNKTWAFSHDEIGTKAYEFTKTILSFGPRSPLNREGHDKTGRFIETTIKEAGIMIESYPFGVKTDFGNLSFKNYLARIPTPNQDVHETIVFMAHYDSKYFSDKVFLGANDSASAIGLLLALMEYFKENIPPVNLEFLFLDGEEALKNWTSKDSLYGSRWQSHLWKKQGREKDNLSLILLDMVGGTNPNFCKERAFSDSSLVQKVWDSATGVGERELFSDTCESQVEDDHTPFSKKGFSTVDIIDTPFPYYWHNEKDNLDAVDKESLSKVSKVLIAFVKSL